MLVLERIHSEALARPDRVAVVNNGEPLTYLALHRLIAAAMTKGRHTSWDFQPRTDASLTYVRNHLDLDDIEYRSRLPHVEVPAKRT